MLGSNCPIRSGEKDRRIDDGLPMISKDHEVSAKEVKTALCLSNFKQN